MKNSIRKGVYIPDDIYDEMMRECARLDRNLSWLLQRAWVMARERIAEFPSVEDLENSSAHH